jgi:hypothetical protein
MDRYTDLLPRGLDHALGISVAGRDTRKAQRDGEHRQHGEPLHGQSHPVRYAMGTNVHGKHGACRVGRYRDPAKPANYGIPLHRPMRVLTNAALFQACLRSRTCPTGVEWRDALFR